VPDIAGLEFVKEDAVTSFNEYHPTINNIGSRNLFELSELEENIIVLLGDSFFFGYGLNDNETVSYFLNKFDSSKKYVNLALPGANVIDSVAIYFSKWKNMKAPSAIILQLLWSNDICASSLIEHRAFEIIEKEYKYILPPFRYILSKDKLYLYFINRIYEKIFQDLTKERFEKYIKNPINDLLGATHKNKAKVMVIAYGNKKRFKTYTKWLKQYCLEENIYIIRIENIIDDKYINDRLPDGHPSGQFNKALAKKIILLLKDIEIKN